MDLCIRAAREGTIDGKPGTIEPKIIQTCMVERMGAPATSYSAPRDIAIPLAIVTCAIQDAKHDDGIGAEDKEDAVRKTRG